MHDNADGTLPPLAGLRLDIDTTITVSCSSSSGGRVRCSTRADTLTDEYPEKHDARIVRMLFGT